MHFVIPNFFPQPALSLHPAWRSLLKQGFTILHVNDSLARGVSLLGSEDWSGDLPPLEQVTLDNLHNDLDDCRKLQVRAQLSHNGQLLKS